MSLQGSDDLHWTWKILLDFCVCGHIWFSLVLWSWLGLHTYVGVGLPSSQSYVSVEWFFSKFSALKQYTLSHSFCALGIVLWFTCVFCFMILSDCNHSAGYAVSLFGDLIGEDVLQIHSFYWQDVRPSIPKALPCFILATWDFPYLTCLYLFPQNQEEVE